MKVLMFGWEFPPYASGGLGTACYGLTKGLSNHNIDVTFVMPKAPKDAKADFVKLVGINNLSKISFRQISSFITPYMTSQQYEQRLTSIKRSASDPGDVYGRNLYEEVWRYAQKASLIVEEEDFDIIHAHDWLTYQAGINAKRLSGKPLVVHIHATEFDRTGGSPNPYVYNIEKKGFEESDKIIAVSNFTKNMVMKHYDIPSEKIEVVHNAVEFNDNDFSSEKITSDDKIVLFLGRITIQKGPDYFIEAAKKVSDHLQDVKFIVAGTGDMEHRMIERAAELGIGHKVLFTGFLKGADIDRAYQMADLYVMPSISEPFGITPLEAMRNSTPVIISKQSGVSEVVSHCLKVDFWDIDEMANKMISVLRYSELHSELQRNGIDEVKKFSWDIPAKKCIDVYSKVLGGFSYG